MEKGHLFHPYPACTEAADKELLPGKILYCLNNDNYNNNYKRQLLTCIHICWRVGQHECSETPRGVRGHSQIRQTFELRKLITNH
jgi:hypothetical protein